MTKYHKNLLLYTGTHDNQALCGWVEDQATKDIKALTKIFGTDIADGIVSSIFERVANYAIIPVWDILKLDDSARFNTPGIVNDINWTWKFANIR